MMSAVAITSIIALFYLSAILIAVISNRTRKTFSRSLTRKLFGQDAAELQRLEDDNTVMRNLLMDMIENEAIVLGPLDGPLEERIRRINIQNQRRREIVGEAVVVIRNPSSRIRDPKKNARATVR